MTSKHKSAKLPNVTKLPPEKRYSSVSEIPMDEREAMKQRCFKSKKGKTPRF